MAGSCRPRSYFTITVVDPSTERCCVGSRHDGACCAAVPGTTIIQTISALRIGTRMIRRIRITTTGFVWPDLSALCARPEFATSRRSERAKGGPRSRRSRSCGQIENAGRWLVGPPKTIPRDSSSQILIEQPVQLNSLPKNE